MADSQASIETVIPDRSTPTHLAPEHKAFADLKAILILPTHLADEELLEIDHEIQTAGGETTKDVLEAKLVLTAVSSPRRARFELQVCGIDTSQLEWKATDPSPRDGDNPDAGGPKRKKRRLTLWPDDPSGALERETEGGDVSRPTQSHQGNREWIRVLKLEWLYKSLKDEKPVPMEPFVILEGPCQLAKGSDGRVRIVSPEEGWTRAPHERGTTETDNEEQIRRASSPHAEDHDGGDEERARTLASAAASPAPGPAKDGTSSLKASQESGSETEGASPAPTDMPDWVRQKKIYACQRSTPPDSPNGGFLEQLRKIRRARILIEDEVGVRAYSTSIAALAAFPRRLASPREVAAIPGCDEKIARLFREYRQHGHLQAADQIKNDPALSVIGQFYDIWGVGARTAREFYYDRGWRRTDDIIEQGWENLTRVQQIGLKYQDEFAHKIPRSEVEYIASVVTYHARKFVDDGIECVIVGGYRRGKAESGDVDLILSHRREEATSHLVRPLVHVLERSGWVTHLLTLSEKNSVRDQEPIPIRPRAEAGAGFDTLDKALVVWQDPTWGTKADDLAADPDAPNPNLHRRVDIIITPWRTVGCAVAGWTSGTTFQRDLRRYAKRVKWWKFDSSGVRDRGTGQWVDVERWTDEKTRAQTWQEAERRVFEGLGLEWREPWERSTD